MAPGLSAKYPLEIEFNARPRAEYHTEAYYELDLPVAPAVMLDQEIVVEGGDIKQYDLEKAICRRLGLPEPLPLDH